MERINVRRVLLGGFVAGGVMTAFEVVLNTMQIVPDAWADALRSIGRPEEFSSIQIAQLTLLAFALGVMMVWLYAAIRPRFGPRLATAVIAGAAVWIVSLISNISLAIMDACPAMFLLVGSLVRAVEYVAASIAGSFLYTD